ncbi:hypothetical protein KJ766_00190 [Patescibacteria group bacterium]|nr:hypothetical protein [Patescibacteria group bacterium]
MTFLELSNVTLMAGAGIAGAASLWGTWFSVICRNSEGECSTAWHTMLARMLAPMEFGVLLTILGWYFGLFAARRLSFAGVSLSEIDVNTALSIFEMQFLPVIAIIFITLIGFGFIRTPSKNTWWEFEWMYVFNFLAVIALFLAPVFVMNNGGFAVGISNIVLALSFGTSFVIVFQFLENRKNALAEITYKNFTAMYKFIFSALGIFVLVQILQLNGSLLVTVPFIFKEIIFAVSIILLAWVSGPVQDGFLHVQKKYKLFEIRNPENKISTLCVFVSVAFTLLFLLSSVIIDISSFTLLQMVILFVSVQSAALFLILVVGTKKIEE